MIKIALICSKLTLELTRAPKKLAETERTFFASG